MNHAAADSHHLRAALPSLSQVVSMVINRPTCNSIWRVAPYITHPENVWREPCTIAASSHTWQTDTQENANDAVTAHLSVYNPMKGRKLSKTQTTIIGRREASWSGWSVQDKAAAGSSKRTKGKEALKWWSDTQSVVTDAWERWRWRLAPSTVPDLLLQRHAPSTSHGTTITYGTSWFGHRNASADSDTDETPKFKCTKNWLKTCYYSTWSWWMVLEEYHFVHVLSMAHPPQNPCNREWKGKQNCDDSGACLYFS